MSSSGSAFIGQPPNNKRDELIITGFWHTFGKYEDFDPSKGLFFFPKRPPGYVYEDKSTALVIVSIVMLILPFLVTSLRLGLRYFIKRMSWGWDDWTIIPATLMIMACEIISVFMVTQGGAGKHVWDITYVEFDRFMTLTTIFSILFYVAVGTVKISIVFFNLRLTAMASKKWRYANLVLLVPLVAYTLLSFFWVTFRCRPVRFSFSREYAGAMDSPPRCSDVGLILKVLSISHTILDFFLLLTPIAVIYKVKMPCADKVRLIGLFSLGGVSCAASVGRIITFQSKHPDVTYHFTSLHAWNVVDMTMSCMVASLPILNVLFSRKTYRRSEADATDATDTTLGGTSFHSSTTQLGLASSLDSVLPKSRVDMLDLELQRSHDSSNSSDGGSGYRQGETEWDSQGGRVGVAQ